MNDRSAQALICPACRTRLRVAAGQADVESPCPECGQLLVINLDRRVVACVPRSIATQPVVSRGVWIELLDLLRQHRIGVSIFAASLVGLCSLLLLPNKRPRASVPDAVQAAAKERFERSAVDDADVTAAANGENSPTVEGQSAPSKMATNLQPVEIAAEQRPASQPLVAVVAVEPPPEPEPRGVHRLDDGIVLANAQQAVVDERPQGPTRAELLQKTLKQRFVSFQIPTKTPLRQVLRELNEVANGLIEIDETVSAAVLKQSITVSLKDAMLLDVLNDVANASSLKLSIEDDVIRLHN